MSERDTFVASRRADWDRLDRLVSESKLDGRSWSEMAALYRVLCADLSRAASMDLGEDVRAYLDELAGRAHNALYGTRQGVRFGLGKLIAVDVPRELRANMGYFLAANLLFYGPMLIGFLAPLFDPSFATAVLPEAALANIETMYSDDEVGRSAGQDAMMAGFYVYNNVGIAFRCFATGALGGLGSVFFLVYNGLVLGTVQGYLTSLGLGWNLLSFVCGHGPWELTGITLSGAAGLKLGWALIDTGGLTRFGSVRRVAPSLFRLVSGTAFMLLVAAAIEGFWSAGPASLPVRLVFSGIQIAIVVSWLTFGGRGAR